MEKILNDSDESQSVHAKFSRSTFDNILFMRDNGGRRSARTSTPLQYLNCKRFVIRSVVLSSLRRSPRDAGAIFCAAFCIIQSVRRINGVKISSASVHEGIRIVASR